jgi:hypothetical protein
VVVQVGVFGGQPDGYDAIGLVRTWDHFVLGDFEPRPPNPGAPAATEDRVERCDEAARGWARDELVVLVALECEGEAVAGDDDRARIGRFGVAAARYFVSHTLSALWMETGSVSRLSRYSWATEEEALGSAVVGDHLVRGVPLFSYAA